MIIENCSVEIDDTFAISIWDLDRPENIEPFLYQPYYPNGTPFTDLDSAVIWATEYIKQRNENTL